ncbi:FKBP-type peptidyl-prolyl cis-trans isomerase [Salinibaculum salinum]|uniref:FKBP-type peptidyl-prolyl cis-trans isomerase n=1 Tax=Salinibaculum salinum TaxID=3131996 RepID=UPI0030EE9585
MTIEEGDRVKVAFTATYPDGELFDTSSREVAVDHGLEMDKRFRPIVLEIGAEPAIESLQDGLLGLENGDTAQIEVPHEDFTFTYDRHEFETMVDTPVEVGQEIHAMTGLLGEVVEVTDDSVTVDFDPERSGEMLTFDVEVLDVE